MLIKENLLNNLLIQLMSLLNFFVPVPRHKKLMNP